VVLLVRFSLFVHFATSQIFSIKENDNINDIAQRIYRGTTSRKWGFCKQKHNFLLHHVLESDILNIERGKR